MEPEVLVRRVALVALPLLLLLGYLLRSTDADDPEAARPLPSVAGLASAASSAAPLPPDGIWESREAQKPATSIADERPSRKVPHPEPPPEPVEAVVAARLPEAKLEPAPPAAPRGSPCGGLVVRLITMADDPKFAFASMATSYDASAKILRVGESMAGYRVTGIEWDRVWVQGTGGRCAVGMHLGAREAEAEVQDQSPGEAYARLPWVLPHAITSGMFKRSEMDWELTDDAVARLYERGADVFAGLRVRMHDADDDAAGLELHDVQLDSFLERLGILSGDVLLKIGGEPVTTADDVGNALQAFREESELVVDFSRKGENYQLKLRVQELR